jgi:hypothetical protein
MLMLQLPDVVQVVHAEANALLNKNQAHVTGAVRTLVTPRCAEPASAAQLCSADSAVRLCQYPRYTTRMCWHPIAVAFPRLSRA